MFQCQRLNTKLLTLRGRVIAFQDFHSLVLEDKGIFKALCCYLVAQMCPGLCDHKDYSSPGSSVHGIFPGKNTRVGCHFLLLGIFLTSGSKSSKKSLLFSWQTRALICLFFSKTQVGLDVGLAGWNIMIPSIMFIIHAFASLRNQIRINKLLALSQILVSVIYLLITSRRGSGKKQQWFTRGQLPSDWLMLASESFFKDIFRRERRVGV